MVCLLKFQRRKEFKVARSQLEITRLNLKVHRKIKEGDTCIRGATVRISLMIKQSKTRV